MAAQPKVNIVLESKVFGRELFSYEDDGQAFEALRELLAEARSVIRQDGIERVIGILLSPDQG